MADEAINHDGVSATATVAGKAVKWGAIGALAAFAIPAAVGVIAGMGIAALATGGVLGAIASVTGFLVGAAGVGAGIYSAAVYGGTAAVGGGLLGAIKGGSQVSRENAAYQNRHHSHGQNRQLATAKTFNDGEIKGIQEGYQLARADMEPAIQQREQRAFQKGQDMVVEQIQEHMNAQMGAQASQTKTGKFADKEIALKCESKAQAVIKERDLAAMQPKQLS